MATRTFTKSELRDDLDLPKRVGKYKEVEVLEDNIVDHRRWTVEHELIFRLPDQPEGEAWQVSYQVGATESQDEGPWEHDDEVEAVLVRAVEKTLTVWEVAS